MIEQTVMPEQMQEDHHYDFRGGRWWHCVQDECDGVHHYFTRLQ